MSEKVLSDRQRCALQSPDGGYDKIYMLDQNPLIFSIRGTTYSADTSKENTLPNT